MVDVHKGRKVTVPIVITISQLERVEQIAGTVPGADKRSWTIRELLKRGIEAWEKEVRR